MKRSSFLGLDVARQIIEGSLDPDDRVPPLRVYSLYPLEMEEIDTLRRRANRLLECIRTREESQFIPGHTAHLRRLYDELIVVIGRELALWRSFHGE